MDVLTIVSIVIGAIAALFGGFWLNAKGKLTQLYLLGKESVDVAKAAIDALEDDKITPEEVAKIKKEAEEVKEAWHKLLGK